MKHILKFQTNTISICFLCLTLIVTGTFCVPVISYATSTQEKLDDTNKLLEELRESQKNLDSDLSDLNTKLDNAAANLISIKEQISAKEASITTLEADIEQAIEYEEQQYDLMKLRIKYMYENGSSSSALSLLLESGNLETFLTRAEYISKISAYDRNMLEQYHANYLALVDAREKLQREKEDLLTLQRDAENRQNEIRLTINDTKGKIDTSSEQIKEAEALALKYEQQIQAEIIARQEEERRRAEEEARRNQNNLTLQQMTSNTLINYTPEEFEMLAAIIECESANQPLEGKLAVGSVVINRINNPRWPNTLTEVLYQPNQFTPVKSGRFAIVLARGANAACRQAALQVLTGGSTIDALFFHVVREGETGGTVIADHIFF